jgi:hypothetical protein
MRPVCHAWPKARRDAVTSILAARTVSLDQGHKTCAQQPTERGVNRGLVANLIFPQPAVADRQVILEIAGLELEQLHTATLPGAQPPHIGSTSAPATCIVRPSPARHISPTRDADSLLGEPRQLAPQI